ncbi:tRNA1(Val) (adenine(37)-N6)-methyltransferase [Taibaiella helva]|uniref:tRNA1(Val) (adenine(37)-N6)-methyltransferase n=1 Tax=Taibaiella helva TaxID=2301235 RepID=UPI000E5714CB|nr:methyltransferase [Taibaiella helva]
MPNSWFQFKQFRIEQDRCAMKVSTDACIQGAWAARQMQHLFPGDAPVRLLDIGTGTGLLSLMLAQEKDNVFIDAIELNEEAALQAAENFHASSWSSRLTARHISLSAHTGQGGTYDFIICNPPFFHNQLGSEQQARHDARHSTALDKETLAQAISALLDKEGYCCIMYPLSEWNDWLKTADRHGLYPARVLMVQPGAGAAANRMIGLFSGEAKTSATNTLVTYESKGSYSASFRELLRPYYLAL